MWRSKPLATRNTFTSQYLATGCNSLVREIDDEMMNIHRFVVDLDAWKWWWPCFAETFWGEDVDSSLRSVTSTPRNSQSSLGKNPRIYGVFQPLAVLMFNNFCSELLLIT